MSAQTCGTCKHFRRDPVNLLIGHCRAVPPTPALAMNRQGQVVVVGSGFAGVEARQEGCGIYTAKLEALT